MHAHTRARGVLAPAVPSTPAGRRTGDSGEDAGVGFSQPVPIVQAEEGEFDFSRPFLVDIGRAAVIAEYLRESGYPRCTADVVTDELARPDRERSGVGHVAAGLLKQARWRP
jgi:hypothetical protein